MATPTFTGGSGTPEAEVGEASSDRVGSVYARNLLAEGGAVLYVCKLVDALTGQYGWEPIVSNADVP